MVTTQQIRNIERIQAAARHEQNLADIYAQLKWITPLAEHLANAQELAALSGDLIREAFPGRES